MDAPTIIALIALSTTFLGGVISGVWYLGSKLGTVQATVLGVRDMVVTIRDNHLHDINDRLAKVEAVLMKGD